MANLLIKDLHAIAKGFPENTAEWPHIPCPTCRRGALSLVADSYVMEEAETSKAWHAHDAWDPDYANGWFNAMLRCGNKSCDLVRVSGRMSVDMDFKGSEGWDGASYIAWLTPEVFLPALPLFEHHDGSPETVQKLIQVAAKVIWLDPSSAANRLRSATEALMDELGIPRWASGKRGRPVEVKLHARIENLKKARPEYEDAADLLLAVKWIGNVGSHEDHLRVADVLDGVEILDHTLTLIYDNTVDDIKRKAAEITARKGIPARRLAP
ncbi:DUF4145 domain-containing protein [Streptomyces sp. NPDC057445]|uniref:DUF4145 domain-containing protein n=1 Tax=Streptomyces sp. NPDC057445 TaxID=3346136 RepID=UPI0036C473B9